jgi:hypothetical protein
MATRKILWFLLFSIFLFTSCSQIRVSQDFPPHIPFHEYSTYNWFLENPTDSPRNSSNPLLHNRFKKEIDAQLLQKGFKPSDTPDFLVSYTYGISSKIQSHPAQPSFIFGYGRYNRYGGIGIYSSPEVYQYNQGELVINFIDSKRKNIIWRGKGTDIAITHPTPEQTSKQVKALVTKILEQFPPQ